MSDKTEQPTEKRREEARKKGQVAKGADLTTCVQLGVLLLYFWWQGGALWQAMQALIDVSIQVINLPLREASNRILQASAMLSLKFIAPLCLYLLISSLASILLQIGPMLAPEALEIKGEKLNPVNNFKQVFSLKSLVEFGKSLLKICVLSAIFYFLLRQHMNTLQFLPACGIECGVTFTARLAVMMWAALVLLYVVVGVLDFAFQRWQLTKELMMSREEVEREYKEMEGSPEIKKKRKEAHRELLNGELASNVKKSSVLVRNPTHIAVCLYYKEGETPLPQVLAMGVDELAKHMVAIAEAAGVPIVEQIHVARTLHAQVKVNDYIPAALFEPVADILRIVTEMKEA